MEAFLAKWGIELIFGLIASGITGYFAWQSNKLKKRMDESDLYREAQEKAKVEQIIEEKIKPLKEEHKHMDEDIEKKLQPLYDELEHLREYSRSIESDKEDMKKLLIDSWKYRLSTLCKAHIEHNGITMSQYNQLQEFFKCYTALGGNGQAKELYLRAIALPIIPEKE